MRNEKSEIPLMHFHGVDRPHANPRQGRDWLIGIFLSLIALFPAGVTSPAVAACTAVNNTRLNLTLPDYPFWRIIVGQMEQCGNVDARYDFDANSVAVDPAVPDRDLGSLVGVSNASLYRLNRQELLRPLDDLVDKYENRLHPRQLIRVEGKVMAIAVAANTRALMVHEELFLREGIKIPTTHDELAKAANSLKGGQLYTKPLTLAYKSGWNLTQAFVDLYLGSGEKLLDENGFPLVNDKAGIATLERMKSLAAFLDEDYLETDPAKALDDLLKFRAPMSVLWISSAGPLENPSVSRVAGKMKIVSAPSVEPGGPPASSLWWDGFAIPVSATVEEAEAAFRTALEGLDQDMLEVGRDNALWLVKDYEPGRLTREVLAAIDAGMIAYPASEATDLLRRALNPQISAFMKGEKPAAAALDQAVSDYMKAARERGLVTEGG